MEVTVSGTQSLLSFNYDVISCANKRLFRCLQRTIHYLRVIHYYDVTVYGNVIGTFIYVKLIYNSIYRYLGARRAQNISMRFTVYLVYIFNMHLNNC